MTQTEAESDQEPTETDETVLHPLSLTALAALSLDTDRLMLEGVDTTEHPLFTVSEMASFFFARSAHWVRWLEKCHFHSSKGGQRTTCTVAPIDHTPKMRAAHQHTWRFLYEGELLSAQRTASHSRKYDLALVEKITHALALNGTIDGRQLHQALLLVKVLAEMYGYIDTSPPEPEPDEDEPDGGEE
jgi:hypothetical protein